MVGNTENLFVRARGAAVVAALALTLSGCALGMSEFARTAQNTAETLPVKEASLDGNAVPLVPAALVEVEPVPDKVQSPAAVAASTVVPTNHYPNLNEVPPPSKSKLLSPEEKARVIAELEGLAKAQGVAITKERAAAKAACDNLSADELRKRMLQGQC